jgi:hypothetical protein
MAAQRAVRKSREEWESLIRVWAESDLSVTAFCQQQRVGIATFNRWRKQLTRPAVAPSFIDLGNLTRATPVSGWTIVLSLGNGVELRLSQS